MSGVQSEALPAGAGESLEWFGSRHYQHDVILVAITESPWCDGACYACRSLGIVKEAGWRLFDTTNMFCSLESRAPTGT